MSASLDTPVPLLQLIDKIFDAVCYQRAINGHFCSVFDHTDWYKTNNCKREKLASVINSNIFWWHIIGWKIYKQVDLFLKVQTVYMYICLLPAYFVHNVSLSHLCKCKWKRQSNLKPQNWNLELWSSLLPFRDGYKWEMPN